MAGQRLIDNLFHRFKKNSDINIVFENKDALNSEKPTINLSIHPIRFCDDIFFNFQTNREDIYKKIKRHEVNYDIFYYYADCIRAQMVSIVEKTPIPEKSALIIGQLERDKAVFDGKKYLSLLDFPDQLDKICKTHRKVYFKPHPYLRLRHPHIKKLKQMYPSIELTTENSYQFLAHPSISTVAGINSSVLHEATYFDKKTLFFHTPNFHFGTQDIGIYGDYFSSSFWADILELPDASITLPAQENRLRRIFRDYWSYPELSTAVDLEATPLSNQYIRRHLKNYMLSMFSLTK